MINKNIRLIIAGIGVIGTTALFIYGYAGWGSLTFFISLLTILFHFRNERNLLAFFFVRKNNFEKAEKILNSIKHPENMISSQEAYYYYLMGLTMTQLQQFSKADRYLKKALSTGLRMRNDRAMANLSLANIALAKRQKKQAIRYLNESKKLDDQKILQDHRRELEFMLKRI